MLMQLEQKQLEYFKRLTEDREENAKILEKASMRGVKRSVVDKYSDQAHFIYELLQNADDVRATEAKFYLTPQTLYFIHNGTERFTVSDPDTEEEDKAQNRLGHVNAITSIAHSSKNEASIGKFGVGFKAVFQYTNTPHIYDPNFQFKIERFIVPRLLITNELAIPREPHETVFFFPFDMSEMPKEKAYSDILQKLKSLVHPILFLSNLKEVVWEAGEEKGRYGKVIKETKNQNDITYQLINLIEEKAGEKKEKSLWLFTRFLNEEQGNHKYSVGFFLNEKGKLEGVDYTAFCFFPTKETTNLKFIIQAPFLLTDSREGIKAGEDWNKTLIEKLAALAAESLPILRDIGLAANNLLIEDDTMHNIIPYKISDFENYGNNKISFEPFYSAIKAKFKSERLLPAKGGVYASKEDAYWAEYSGITNLFSNEQLAALLKQKDAKWAFPSIGRDKAKFKGNPDLGTI
jgi:hypothetical protein